MCRLFLFCFACTFPVGLAAAQSPQAPNARCESLKSIALDHAKVVAATIAGADTAMPEAKLTPVQAAALPSFCRVRIEDRPTADSEIMTEVWLPLTGWNGNFRGEGNGGFAGQIYYDQMAAAVALHYATAGTDTGHPETTGAFALGHPEKIKDFGWRAIHDMTVQAKQVIAAFYGKPAQHAYFAACSDGGREALMEAQRFPADYDGILAGAPAYHWTALVSAAADNEKQDHSSAAAHLPVSKLAILANAVRATCDANDGVKDGILNDPRSCKFDPSTLLCKPSDAGDSATCLTADQVATVKTIYAAKRDAQGHIVIPGFALGAEDAPLSWGRWIFDENALQLFFATGFYSNFVYKDPDWSLQTFDFARDYKLANEKTGEALNATDTNLKPFLAHGGRLILYHGFNDPAIPAVGTIDYFDRMSARVGDAEAKKGVRLYMVPGMLHCSGGPGATGFGQNQNLAEASDPQHNMLTALEQWVEKGTAPATLTASKFTNDDPTKPVLMTRPLCPYPALPKYIKGDANDAKSFTCAVAHP